jgi:tetratricopeptide (TPR) repeat protein
MVAPEQTTSFNDAGLMDRFSQLELGSVHPDEPGKPGEPIRDAHYFHQEALRYWLAGDFEVALRNYSRTLEQDSSFFAGWSGQLRMLLELDEYKEADLWADKAMGLFPDHPELLALKAVANKRDNKLREAIAFSDNAVGKEDLTPRVWLARAEVFLERKHAVVDGCLSKAISLATADKATIKLEAGRLLRRKKSYARAMAYLNEALQTLPESALAWYELGCCQARMGLSQASHSLEEALRIHPHWDLASEALQGIEGRGFWGRLFKR